MMRPKRLRVLVGFGTMAAIGLPAHVGFAENRPEILTEIGIDQKLGAQLPLDLQFRDSDGKTVRLGQFFDGRKPAILTLVYYECPMLCTLALNDTARVLKEIPQTPGKDFEVITVSFNPRETPALAAAKKANYLKQYGRAGAEKGWHFLVGDEAAIARLTQAVGFRYRWDDKTHQYAHPTGLIILTPTGAVARYFFGIGYEPKDIRLSLVEASQRKIGSFTDALLLSCCTFDAKQGRYTWAVIGMLRVAGAIMLVALASLLIVLFRRERRERPVLAGDSGHLESLEERHSDDR